MAATTAGGGTPGSTSAIATDHNEPDLGGQRRAERGQHERRRPLQRVLPGKPAAERAAVDGPVHRERVGSGECHEDPEQDQGYRQGPRRDDQRLGGPSQLATERTHQLRVEPVTPSTSQSMDSSQTSTWPCDLPAAITVLPVLSCMGPL